MIDIPTRSLGLELRYENIVHEGAWRPRRLPPECAAFSYPNECPKAQVGILGNAQTVFLVVVHECCEQQKIVLLRLEHVGQHRSASSW
jgi:hypothetical protein